MEVYLGTKESDGSDVSIHETDRRKHMAIFGKSGVGKTTLMRNMIAADLHAGNGLTVVDPHGSLIEDLLEIIPRRRTNDVIYLNPAELVIRTSLARYGRDRQAVEKMLDRFLLN